MAQIKKVKSTEQKIVNRAWGYEIWIENLPEYCGKLLRLYKGERCSLHFHMNKMETMYLKTGYVKIRFVDPSDGQAYNINLDPGDSVRIPRGQAHQIIALEDSYLFEFSTMHEESDSYRVEKGSK